MAENNIVESIERVNKKRWILWLERYMITINVIVLSLSGVIMISMVTYFYYQPLPLKYIITIFVVMGGGGILILLKPYTGIIIYYLLILFFPFGGLHLTLLIGGLTLYAWLVEMVRKGEYDLVFNRTQTYLLFGILGAIIISILFAKDRSYCLEPLLDFCGIIFFYLITINVINRFKFLKTLVLGVIFILSFTVIRCGVSYITSGYTYICSPALDNNDFALALVMAVPFCYYWFISEREFLKKMVAFGLFLILSAGVILTFSRGGFLGLIIILSIIFLKARRKFFFIWGGISLLLITVLFFMPKDYSERINSITKYYEDESAMSRIEAWKAGWEMIKESPFTGIGVGNFEPFSPRYNPEMKYPLLAHNSFIQRTAESGIFALTLFLLLIGTSIKDLYQIRWKARENRLFWAIPFTQMIEVSFYGYIVSASFLSKENFDLLYLLPALTVSLKENVLRKQISLSENKSE